MINNLFSTKRFFIALTSTASIATALSLAACQDFDNGMDDETIKRAEFTKNFIEEFGTPAPNHQWGFDVAQAVMTGNSASATRGAYDGNYIKSNEMYYVGTQDYRATIIFGQAKNITQHEHDEVFAWFSNHRVNWANPCTNSEVNPTESRKTTDGGDKIIAHRINASNPNYGSLANNASNPLGETYTDNNELYFFNGWIQHVARDNSYDEVSWPKDGVTSTYNADNMDFLAFRHVSDVSEMVHLRDFNGAQGYGWDNQTTTTNPDQILNAGLVFDAKFDVVTYGCSSDGSRPHNKYYIVYLQGDDYAGYYLGMDLEGFDPDAERLGNANKNVNADGICNDWIIKIGDAGAKPFNPSRIMCEDLGARDFDYNDVVYDVEYRDNVATITVQAAGGTIPIGLYYKNDQLKKGTEGEIHTLFGSAVTTPVNVGKGDTKNPITFKLKFNATNTTDTYQDPSQNWANVKYDYYSSEPFNLQNILVKVKHTTNAEWVTLSNYEGSVPLKFCVPNTVKWTIENGYIEKAYPGFKTWVGNPTKWFWTGTKDESILYTRGN